MTGETLGYVMEKLMESGALDAFFTPIYMKKNRPAVKLSVLTDMDKKTQLTELLLKETSTFGVRSSLWNRSVLDRKIIEKETPYGKVRCKVGSLAGKIIKITPEYEDCKKIAEEHQVPIWQVFNAIDREIDIL